MCQSRILLSVSIAAFLLLAGSGGSAAQQEDGQLTERIDRLIRELDHDDFKVREKATAELAEIGGPAIDKVTAATKDDSAERRQRAIKVLALLRRAEVGLRLVSQIKHEALSGAVTVVFSPDGKFLYVPAWQAHSVNVFARDAASGALSHVQSLVDEKQLGGAVKLRLSPDGKLATLAAFRSKSVALFSRDATTGKLTLESVRMHEPDGELQLAWPIDAIFSTDGRFVYVADDNQGRVVVFKVAGGKTLELVEAYAGEENCFAGARGITAHPDGKTLYVGSRQPGTLAVLNRNVETGKLSVRQLIIDETGGTRALGGLTGTRVSADGKFVYAIAGRFEGDNALSVFQVGTDGKLTLLQELSADKGEINDFAGPNELIISPDGTQVYASGTRSGSVACFTRNPASGKLTFITTLQSVGTGKEADLGANGMMISAEGKYLYLVLENASSVSVFERTRGLVMP